MRRTLCVRFQNRVRGQIRPVFVDLGPNALLMLLTLTSRACCLASLLALSSIQGWAQSSLDYPSLYRELGLPEYPAATVAQLGRVNDSLADGLSITLETTASHSELRDFYESQLAALGWALQETVATQRMRAAGILQTKPFSGVFCAATGTSYTVRATDTGAYRQVQLSVVGDSASCDQP